MNLLLDTCTFLWMIASPEELSKKVRRLCEDSKKTLYLSAISSWEITLKYSLSKLQLDTRPDKFIPAQRERHNIDALAFDEASAIHFIQLPPIHQDPFDRMLVCQAIVHYLIILTPDESIRDYPVKVIW